VISNRQVPDDFFDDWTHQGPESDDEEDTFECKKSSYEVSHGVVTAMLNWAEMMGLSFQCQDISEAYNPVSLEEGFESEFDNKNEENDKDNTTSMDIDQESIPEWYWKMEEDTQMEVNDKVMNIDDIKTAYMATLDDEEEEEEVMDEPEIVGRCCECGEYGPAGMYCTMCEDCSMIYEVNEFDTKDELKDDSEGSGEVDQMTGFLVKVGFGTNRINELKNLFEQLGIDPVREVLLCLPRLNLELNWTGSQYHLLVVDQLGMMRIGIIEENV
jgi:hypothetical protein